MASSTNFGASIVQSPYKNHTAQDALLPPSGLDSPVLTPVVSREDVGSDYVLGSKPIPPHSPFYQHPPTSMERITTHSRQQSKSHLGVTSEKELETGFTPLATPSYNPHGEANPFTSAVSLEHNKECKSMWPSKQTLMLQRAETRREKHSKRACGGFAPVRQWWAKFDKRQRLIMKILMAFVTVGAIVAICVGISVAVHGTYYSNKGQQSVQN